MKKILIISLLMLTVPATGCEAENKTTKAVQTVDWYMAKENKDALKAVLAKCNNNPGELKDDPNCINARTAQHKLVGRRESTKDFEFVVPRKN